MSDQLTNQDHQSLQSLLNKEEKRFDEAIKTDTKFEELKAIHRRVKLLKTQLMQAGGFSAANQEKTSKDTTRH